MLTEAAFQNSSPFTKSECNDKCLKLLRCTIHKSECRDVIYVLNDYGCNEPEKMMVMSCWDDFFRIDSCTVHCVENWPLRLVNELGQCLSSEWKLTVCSRAMFPSKHLHSWCHSALSFCINTHAFHNTVKSCTCKSSPSPLKKHVAFKRFFVKRLINSPCIIFVTTFWNVKNLWNSN